MGINRQFPGQVSVGVAATHRRYQDNFAELEINGFYPDGPNKPFLGFGKVDPPWTDVIVNALEVTLAKNMSHGFQIIASATRQWN